MVAIVQAAKVEISFPFSSIAVGYKHGLSFLPRAVELGLPVFWFKLALNNFLRADRQTPKVSSVNY
jgi:hypothetical protein